MDDIRVIEGDCLAVLAGMESGTVDAVVTDLPYALEFNSAPHSGGAGRGTRRLDFSFLGTREAALAGLKASVRLLRAGGFLFAFTGSDLFGDSLAVLRNAGLTAKPFAWVKECPAPAPPGTVMASAFELAVYGYSEGVYVGSHDPKRRNVAIEDSYRHGQPGKVAHPTQKPLVLLRRLVRDYCPPGGLVLDPFAGSGTTGVAALQTGRRAVLIEREPAYVEIIRRRLADARGESGLFAPGASA